MPITNKLLFATKIWDLVNLEQLVSLNANYVVTAYSHVFKQEVVVKIIPEYNEFINEKNALLNLNKTYCCKLLDCLTEFKILLLEKISGVHLIKLFPDYEYSALYLVSELMTKLAITKDHCLIKSPPRLDDWIDEALSCSCPILNSVVLSLAYAISDKLLKLPNYYLHGDLHHANIFINTSNQAIAIDPKGVVGPLIYEVGAYMRNPVPLITRRANFEEILVKRINFFSLNLNFTPTQIIEASFLATLLGICWSYQAKDNLWLEWLKLLSVFKKYL